MVMAWSWLLRRLSGGSHSSGFFGYLTSRDRNKTRIERDKVRMEETRELIGLLPYGAVYREGTADGWREIRMPPPVFALPTEHHEPTYQSPEPVELPELPKALEQEVSPPGQDPPTRA